MDALTNITAQNIEKESSTINLQKKDTQEISQTDVLQKIEDDDSKIDFTLNSKEQMDELITELNNAVEPMSTNVKFGVDADDIFFVAVMDTETNQMIRRFPAEKAVSFLSKMQEVSGMLFDSKG